MFERRTRSSFPIRSILLLAAALIALFGIVFRLKQSPPPASPLDTKGLKPDEIMSAAHEYPTFRPDLDMYFLALQMANEGVASRDVAGPISTTPWTVQGPANIGARVTTIKVHPTNSNIIYLGYGGGGVWKTTNGGQSWTPIFDQQDRLCIGDIELDPQNPNIIYVATGDPSISITSSVGNGLWKSSDGGASWTYIGLAETRIISEIIIHPTNSNIIWAATMGNPTERTPERGVYKTTNGGLNWQKTLYIDNQTGIAGLELDPVNPAIIWASSYPRIRTAQESMVSAPTAGVWKSTDGGSNWNRQFGGLPTDNKGRVGISVDATNPSRLLAVYADSTSVFHDIYETLDGGVSWDTLPKLGLDPNFQRGMSWYFGKIFINPFNPQDIWVCGVDMWRSTDGGQSFFMTTPEWFLYEVHADKHQVVFVDATTVLIGTDGGMYRSTDSGYTWTKAEEIPTTQFYKVAYNPHIPEYYYGGAQDQGTSVGNADEINLWFRVYGGDGFGSAFHPTDPNIYYYSTQNGNLAATVDGGMSFTGASEGFDANDRRYWDMPYLISQHDPEAMIAGSHKVHLSYGHPAFWAPVSEDLTDGNIYGRIFHCISTLTESPLDSKSLYVGTTDGNVWRGDVIAAEWTKISDGLPDRYVTGIAASAINVNRVFVTHSGYRSNDFSPHIHRSDNKGQSWVSIAGDLPPLALYDVALIPNRGDSVLCVASDAGIFVTTNGGQNWQKLGIMPSIYVNDLEINTTQRTLIAGTFSRSIMTFPLDSIYTPLISSQQEPQTIFAIRLTAMPSVVEKGQTMQLQIAGITGAADLIISDLSGRVALQQAINGSGHVPVQTNNWPAGTYLAYIRQQGRVVVVQKWVVQG